MDGLDEQDGDGISKGWPNKQTDIRAISQSGCSLVDIYTYRIDDVIGHVMQLIQSPTVDVRRYYCCTLTPLAPFPSASR